MILTRAPLRITFGGGGSDLKEFSSKFGGFCISAAISKYAYVSINRTFQPEIFLKYSKLENVDRIGAIEHPIIRECLRYVGYETPQVEIASMADVPSNGSGLGNSGSFTVALLKALFAHKNISTSSNEIAEDACNINMNILKFVQGKQDEYISSLGGIRALTFNQDGTVESRPLKMNYDTIIELEDNLMLFYTGVNHSTNDILKVQEQKTKDNDQDIINNLHEVKEIGWLSMKYLESGNLKEFGELMNMQWHNKNKRSPASHSLEEIRTQMLLNGARGVKLIGSGQGGFFLTYAIDKNRIRNFMKNKMQEMRFKFDFEGVKQLI